MFDLPPVILGYYISAALCILGAVLMGFGYWYRKKANFTPVVALSQQVPNADGLCETTVWVANPTTKNVYIRNFILKSGTFATDEIRNAVGQIVGYRKGYSSFHSASYTVPSGTESNTSIAFHMEKGLPVAVELVGKKGVYDIHFTQHKRKGNLLPFLKNSQTPQAESDTAPNPASDPVHSPAPDAEQPRPESM